MKALPMPISPSRARRSPVGYTASNMPQVVVECKGYTHRRKEPVIQMKLHRALTSVLALAVVAGPAPAPDAPPKKGPATPPPGTSAPLRRTKNTNQYSAPHRRAHRR